MVRLFKEFSRNIAEPAKGLGKVSAVKGIVVRRQMRRRIDLITLSLLLMQFPSVERIHYEPWRVLNHSRGDYGRDEHQAQYFIHNLSQHIRSVTIFEDFNEQIMEAIRTGMNPSFIDQFFRIETKRPLDPGLGNAFAKKSCDLEHLSVSFMIDARHFFTSCKKLKRWPRLRSLILTTPLMTKGDRNRISDLLVNAGEVAQKMPKLKSLAIWYCCREEACAVIFHKKRNNYRKGAGWSTLTWRGTRDFEFSREVVETWQKVVCPWRSRREPCQSHQVLVRAERVEGEIISHGDAIHHLGLPDGVIDPISLRQIRKEGILQKEAWRVV
ncbi:hypothetical protein IL306_002945 [Fusarium sp. DS 682]|nr:hypothetical protein IL306_002945 [Fusarium sp. DS 682]